MKRYGYMLLVILIIIIMITAGKVNKVYNITAGYDEAVPYHYTNDTGIIVGSDADILREILSMINCTIEFKERPWPRTLLAVKSGQLDIAIGAKYTDERAEYAYYSAPYKTIQHWLYTLDNTHEDVKSLETFLKKGKRTLGVVTGWGYPPEIAAYINNDSYKDSIEYVGTFEQLPKMLAAGRLDGIIANPENLAATIAHDKIAKKFVARARYEEQLHFLFSKKSVKPEIVQEFNAVLFKYFNEGRLKGILKKYEVAH